MRFREDTPAFRARAQVRVALWRDEHPEGTADEMAADLAEEFPGYEPALRAFLFSMDEGKSGAEIKDEIRTIIRDCGSIT